MYDECKDTRTSCFSKAMNKALEKYNDKKKLRYVKVYLSPVHWNLIDRLLHLEFGPEAR